MAFITLLNQKLPVIASSSRVIAADEVKAFANSLLLGSQLEELVEQERASIDSANLQGYQDGFEKGHAESKAKANDLFAEKLIELHNQYQIERSKLATSSVRLALQMVRRIAGQLGAERIVGDIAKTVAADYLSTRTTKRLTFRVSIGNTAAVRKQLKTLDENQIGEGSILVESIDVVEDQSLGEFDCIVETDLGSSLASLDTQLSNIERTIFDRTSLN